MEKSDLQGLVGGNIVRTPTGKTFAVTKDWTFQQVKLVGKPLNRDAFARMVGRQKANDVFTEVRGGIAVIEGKTFVVDMDQQTFQQVELVGLPLSPDAFAEACGYKHAREMAEKEAELQLVTT